MCFWFELGPAVNWALLKNGSCKNIFIINLVQQFARCPSLDSGIIKPVSLCLWYLNFAAVREQHPGGNVQFYETMAASHSSLGKRKFGLA